MSAGSDHPPNALAGEKSPYLLQHAHNPVDWLPWGDEARRRAHEEDKPIFLSIGYSTCHWCHVMERESFEDEETAAIMNEHFVNVKVDREERPDVDATYMSFVQASTGQGGWPMSVWLTPDLKPVVGGTYFPPDDKPGRPGFPRVLDYIAGLWRDNREELVQQGDRVVGLMRQEFADRLETGSEEPPGDEVFEVAATQFRGAFDGAHGGFSIAPKFPRPAGVEFLLRRAKRGDAELGEMATRTLVEMACGGIYDHLGGGFHRYSVDRHWHVPHFEKMLYDQAQLAVLYLEAYQESGDEVFRRVAEETLQYVRRDMTDSGGGFYSAEDADSLAIEGGEEKTEGAFYVWSASEVESLLGGSAADRFRVASAAYGLDEGGNVRPESDPMQEFTGLNVLYRAAPAASIAEWINLSPEGAEKLLDEARTMLLEARNQRPRPHLDDKIVTAWNGLMISAFAKGFEVCGEPAYLDAATGAAAFLRRELWDGGAKRLLRSYREGPGAVDGFAADYALLIRGLLDLYEAGFDREWLAWAIELQEGLDERFFDAEHGGYLTVREEPGHAIVSLREQHDGAEPTPSSPGVSNLLRIARFTAREEFKERAARTLGAFATVLQQRPIEMPAMAAALDAWKGPVTEIVIVTGADDSQGEALRREVHRRFLPRRTLIAIDGDEARAFFAKASPAISEMSPVDGKTAVYVCRDFACQQPVTTVEALAEVLDSERES